MSPLDANAKLDEAPRFFSHAPVVIDLEEARVQLPSARFDEVDLVIVRENTEDLYAGIEHRVGPDAAESIKIITRAASQRIARYAFEYAVKNGRRKVTAVHKANIMKLSDGLFLNSARKIHEEEYPNIEYEEVIIDAGCMKLVQNPDRMDVLLMENLYGDIISDLCAGLVGGLGVVPGSNIGESAAVFDVAERSRTCSSASTGRAGERDDGGRSLAGDSDFEL